jgi:phosphatidylglycerophosphate synthase
MNHVMKINPVLPSKLTRLRNWQSHDFWARLFARPLAILFLYPIADVPWITPNLLTHVANLFFVWGIVCLWTKSWIAAAILLNLHLVVDNMDGTLARYRKCGTNLGSYYDKVSDYFGLIAMFVSLGWFAFAASPDQPVLLLLGCGIAIAEVFGGYSKWLTVSIQLKQEGNSQNPNVLKKHEPPNRTLKQWLVWFLDSLWRIVLFEEVDYFFWVGIALILGQLKWVLVLLFVTRWATLIGTLCYRGFMIRKLDTKGRN